MSNRQCRQRIFPLCLLVLVGSVSANQGLDRNIEILAKENYRTEMEEIVVTGQVPKWRQVEREQELWRRNKFEISRSNLESAIEWFPYYSRDERDNDQRDDRTEEKPEFKIFEWAF